MLKFSEKDAKWYAHNKKPMAKEMFRTLKGLEIVLLELDGKVGVKKNSIVDPTLLNDQRRQTNYNKAGRRTF